MGWFAPKNKVCLAATRETIVQDGIFPNVKPLNRAISSCVWRQNHIFLTRRCGSLQQKTRYFQAKPETSVQESVSTFLGMKPLDVVHKPSGHFPAVWSGNKTRHVRRDVGIICSKNPGIFNQQQSERPPLESSLKNMKPLHMFNNVAGQFPAVLVATHPDIFDKMLFIICRVFFFFWWTFILVNTEVKSGNCGAFFFFLTHIFSQWVIFLIPSWQHILKASDWPLSGHSIPLHWPSQTSHCITADVLYCLVVG